ncbi:unnamed protein product, partial [Rotaria sp. Silwood1]
TQTDFTLTTFSLHDAIKRQLWSDFIDNPLLPYYSMILTLSSSSLIVNILSLLSSQTSTSLIQILFDTYIINEFLDFEQSRTLYICSKYVPMNYLILRLLIDINTSNRIYETGRALYFIFDLILFRRCSSTCCLLEQVLPYLFNIKSNEYITNFLIFHMINFLGMLH